MVWRLWLSPGWARRYGLPSPIIFLPSRPGILRAFQEAHILAGHMLCDWIELDWLNSQAKAAEVPHWPG